MLTSSAKFHIFCFGRCEKKQKSLPLSWFYRFGNSTKPTSLSQFPGRECLTMKSIGCQTVPTSYFFFPKTKVSSCRRKHHAWCIKDFSERVFAEKEPERVDFFGQRIRSASPQTEFLQVETKCVEKWSTWPPLGLGFSLEQNDETELCDHLLGFALM